MIGIDLALHHDLRTMGSLHSGQDLVPYNIAASPPNIIQIYPKGIAAPYWVKVDGTSGNHSWALIIPK